MKNVTDIGGTISCSRYPDLTDLHFRNRYWQIFKFSDRTSRHSNQTMDVTFHLYGAYFDNRTLILGPMIRIISMVHSRFVDRILLQKNSEKFSRRKPVSLPFCHIWYNDSASPVVTPVTHFEQVSKYNYTLYGLTRVITILSSSQKPSYCLLRGTTFKCENSLIYSNV